jgi:hypothetical protein
VTSATADRVHALLTASLSAWRVTGEVCRAPDGALLLVAGDARFHIARAPPGQPFRWMVTTGDRTRGVTSVAGLLRVVRSIIDPTHPLTRVRIAPLPDASP